MDHFKIRDASSYNAVAEPFDRFTKIVTNPLARTLIHLAQLRPGDNIIDIGTGSGIVALNAAESNASVRVTGIDLSGGLLSLAGFNSAQTGVTERVRFAIADAEALPFRDSSYDAAVSLFALLHFPHPDRALAEMYRVLKPGGRLAIGIGSGPPWNTLQGWLHRFGRIRDLVHLKTGRLLIAQAHLNRIVAEYVPANDAAEETELAQHRGTRASGAVSLVRQLGLTDLQTRWEGHHLVLDDAQQFWELQTTFSSFSRKRLESATEAQARTVRRHFDRECQRVLARGGKLVYHYAAYYISGRRPLNA